MLNESNSYSDVLRKVGFNPKGGNPNTLKKIINEYNLSTTILDENRKKLFSQCAIGTHLKIKAKIEDIFEGKYPEYQTSKLLKRLVQEGFKEMKCESCGIVEWMGKPITLQLHHNDGNRTNNKLENLKILCPNCHSQTETYAGKNSKTNKDKIKTVEISKKKKSNKISSKAPEREVLKNKIRSIPFVKIGAEYHVSDNAVRRWCDKYGLPRKTSIIKSYSDEEWEKI